MMNRTDNEQTVFRLKKSIDDINTAIIKLSFCASYAVYVLKQDKEDLRSQLNNANQLAKDMGWSLGKKAE